LRFVNPKRLPVSAKSLQKPLILFSGEPDDPHFGNHHGPAENRGDKKHREN
jgi:hypothetical protein